MLVLALCAFAVLSPFLIQRWPAGLLLHPWRWTLVIWAAVVIQLIILRVSLPSGFAPVLHVLTYVMALGFLLKNRRAPGVLIVGAGALSNGVTIALNGGTLPASARAVAAAGTGSNSTFDNTAVLAHPVLPWLGDVFAWPAPLPLANTFSVGDALIVVGVYVAAWSGTRLVGQTTRTSAARRHA